MAELASSASAPAAACLHFGQQVRGKLASSSKWSMHPEREILLPPSIPRHRHSPSFDCLLRVRVLVAQQTLKGPKADEREYVRVGGGRKREDLHNPGHWLADRRDDVRPAFILSLGFISGQQSSGGGSACCTHTIIIIR